MGKLKITGKEQLFNTQLGQSATISRETVKGEVNERANGKLFEIGELLHPMSHTELEHVGSAAMHVYYHKGLRQLFVVNQTGPMKGCPEMAAIAAAKDFTGSLIEFFGHRRPKLRSGF